MRRTLRNETDVGRFYYNRFDSRKRERPRDVWVPISTPPITKEDVFYEAQRQLDAHNHLKTPSRITSSPILLTSVALCDHCASSMRIRTGKGGAYKYYACGQQLDTRRNACPGCSVQMEKLDDAVIEGLLSPLFTPARLTAILNTLLNRAEVSFRRGYVRTVVDKVWVHQGRAQVMGSNEVLFGQMAHYAKADNIAPIRHQEWQAVRGQKRHWNHWTFLT